MDSRLRAWTEPRSEAAAVRDEVEPYRSYTPDERVAEAIALSRYALRFLDRLDAGERHRRLWARERMAPPHWAAWVELVRAGRAG